MGLYSTNASSLNYIHSAGYPVPSYIQGGNSIYSKALWTSYPVENTINLDNSGIISSTSIVTTYGNSGGPLYQYIETWYNGNYSYGTAMLVGISSHFHKTNTTFDYSLFCQIKPFIINLYREVV